MESWQDECRKHHGAEFLKCIIGKGDAEFKAEHEITRLPTYVFIRNGNEIERTNDFAESDHTVPYATSSTKPKDEMAELKHKIIALCSAQ
jgi:hypothetical protein